MSQQAHSDLVELSRLDAEPSFTFDAQPGGDDSAQQRMTVYKTTRRTVVSLRLGRFEAREVLRQGSDRTPLRAGSLAALVGKGMRYDYELIAHVGARSFLDSQRLGPLQQELASRCPAVEAPRSTLHDLRLRFLFLLGAVHRQASSVLHRVLKDERADWLIDGTLEPTTPLFFGIQETRWGILLGCWKVPSEKGKDLAGCLRQAAEQFGSPPRVVHDLGQAMSLACQEALPGVEQRVCHFHFASDVGADLYDRPHRRLSAQLRGLGLQLRLHDQRKGQTDRLRTQVESGRGQLLLAELLAGQRSGAAWDDVLAREVLLALHQWINNYPQDGRRQGFPFDPYLLYLHRRLLKAAAAVGRLVEQTVASIRLPPTFSNLQEQLSRYRNDPEVAAAGSLYEKAHALFERLRAALRLGVSGGAPLRGSYEVQAEEQGRLCQDLVSLRAEAGRLGSVSPKTEESRLYGILGAHLEKYWDQLGVSKPGEVKERTTNRLEGLWGAAKRRCRRATGRGCLSREFRAMPAEMLLVGNLAIPRYVELVMGSLARLPEKLAEAAPSAGTYSHWRRQRGALNTGRLPRRLLAQENFLDKLLAVCNDSAKATDPC